MTREPVQSSNLHAVGYEPLAGLLEIEFRFGHVYIYKNVPEHIHAELMAAASKGRYFNAHIKDRYATDYKGKAPYV